MTQPQSLDIRPVPLPHKHPLIFKTFDELRGGEVEQAPEVWRVNISKIG